MKGPSVAWSKSWDQGVSLLSAGSTRVLPTGKPVNSGGKSMGKSYCPGWSQTVDEGNFCAKTPAYLCGNQPVSQVIASRYLGAAAL